MIPLRDNIPSQTFPIVNYGLIAACTVVFLFQLADDPEGGTLVERYGMIPARVVHPDRPIVVREKVARGWLAMERYRELAKPPFSPWFTLLTCIFLHGGWLHFLGNMWFLHIFGDNVEDRLGHLGFLVFYCACGVLASLAHLATNPESPIPTIGASGAIAGVMGAYFVLYPRASVLTLVPIWIYLEILVLPAPIFLGIWIIFQLLQGTLAISGVEAGGVAWWAHIGGFFVGAAFAMLLRATGWGRPKVVRYYPNTTRAGIRRYRDVW